MDEVNGLLSVTDFLEDRFDWPESGQWSQLVRGQPVHLQPPDLDHGNTILNLSKALATYAQTGAGYPCFSIGLQVTSDPDTVLFPAVSYFLCGERFGEQDHEVTRSVPPLVIELASTADRRQALPQRLDDYFAHGCEFVWVIDPSERTVTVHPRSEDRAPTVFCEEETLDGGPLLPGFCLEVGDLFTEPYWWK